MIADTLPCGVQLMVMCGESLPLFSRNGAKELMQKVHRGSESSLLIYIGQSRALVQPRCT
jgi:hypothetical protein